MSSRRSRNRQLAKLAARRQAERRRKQRQRAIAIVVSLGLVGAAGLFVFVAFKGGNPTPAASGTPTPSATASGQLGTVLPSQPPKEVACGAKQPKDALSPKPQFAQPPKLAIDPAKTYSATFEMSCGDIVVRLLADESPETVNSFVFLADEGFFDGQRFHRIANSIDVIQGGDPTGTGSGGPGYSIPDELESGLAFRVGTLAMANAGPDTGGSQFFFITGPKGLQLPPNYTIFGQIVKGLDVAKRIQKLPVSGETPTQAVYIEKVTITVGK